MRRIRLDYALRLTLTIAGFSSGATNYYMHLRFAEISLLCLYYRCRSFAFLNWTGLGYRSDHMIVVMLFGGLIRWRYIDLQYNTMLYMTLVHYVKLRLFIVMPR